MLTKQSLINTHNLISASNITVVSSVDNEISYNLARGLSCLYFENTQYCSPKTIDEIADIIKNLSVQYELENRSKIELLVLNLYQISNEFDYENFSKKILELNELSKSSNFKTLVLFTIKDISMLAKVRSYSMLAKVYSNFETEQKILFLSMCDEPISLTVETGVHKGKIIFYELDNDVELLKENKIRKLKHPYQVESKFLMGEIIFYYPSGRIKETIDLNNENIARVAGMKMKCHLKNNTEEIGFADVFRLHDEIGFDEKVHDYIYLWTYDYLDEETHELINENYSETNKKIIIDDIVGIEAILFSNPRWGCRWTNKFTVI